MRINNSEVKNYMTLKFAFNGIRIIDNSLDPVEWELSVNMVGVDVLEASQERIQELGSMAYQKVYYWLDSIMPGIVIVDVADEMGVNIANYVENMMMYCPGEPTDDVLIQLIHAKCTAIAGPHLRIGEMVLSSSDTSASYTYAGPDSFGQPSLPKKTGDYMEQESMYSVPWWDRPDGFCFEFIRIEGDDETPLDELYGDVIDPLKEFEKSFNHRKLELIPNEPAEIIHVEKWKPRKV